ncbi:MAG: hypothetical protein M3Q43_09270 [Actinomycetota bacterium]|nr:hypothetical protein [Actinomycetota bacterium]
MSEEGRALGRLRRTASRVATSARRFDGGDPLSTAGRDQPQIVGTAYAVSSA